MHVAESRMTASVGARIAASARFSTRTSPGPCITTPRMVDLLTGVQRSVGALRAPAAGPAWTAAGEGGRLCAEVYPQGIPSRRKASYRGQGGQLHRGP